MSLKPPSTPTPSIPEGGELNAFDFGLFANGVTDDTAAFQNLVNVPNRDIFFPAGTYIVDDIQPTSNVRMRAARGAILKHKTGSTSYVLNIGAATSNVEIDGFEIDSTNAGTGALGVLIGGTKNTIKNCYLHDLKSHGIYVRDGSSFIRVEKNHVQRHYGHGITVGGNTIGTGPTHIDVIENRVQDGLDADSSALGIIGIASHVIFRGNHTYLSGADGIAAYNGDNRDITVDGNTIEDPQGSGNGVHVAGNGVVITGNIFRKANGYPIFCSSDPNPPSTPRSCVNATITGNYIDQGDSATGGAIYVINYTGVTITGNTIDAAAGHGITLEGCAEFSITGGVVRNCVAGSGIRLNKTKEGSVTGVTIRDTGDRGIVMLDDATTLTTDITITGNTIFGCAGKGIDQSNNATGNRCYIANNTLRSNAGGNIGTLSSTSVCGENVVDDSSSIASAASVVIPHGLRYAVITGTTNITGIASASRAVGRTVTLRFAGVLTFTDGSNLVLAGNFVTTAADTITLTCDGVDWYEVGRSVN